MRRRLAIAASAIALVLALALVGLRRRDSGSDQRRRASTAAAGAARPKKGTTVKFWIMPNGPSRRRTWRRWSSRSRPRPASRSTSRSSAGTSSSTASATPPSRARAPTSRRRAPPRCRSSPRSAASRTSTTASRDIGGKAAYAPGVWQTTQVEGQDGTWARAVVHRGARDLLPQGRPQEGRRRSRDGVHRRRRASRRRCRRSRTRCPAASRCPFGTPGKKAFDLVHHVMPFVWDAGGAELNDDAKQSTINSPEAAAGRRVRRRPGHAPGCSTRAMLERDGTQVENQFKGGRLAVWIGGPWVLARSTAPTTRTGPGGARERRRRPDADRSRRQGVHVRRRLEPDDVQVLARTRTRPGRSSSTCPRTDARRTTRTCWACSRRAWRRRSRSATPTTTTRRSSRPSSRAARTRRSRSGAQIENAYKARFGNILDSAAGEGEAYQRGRREVAARRGGQGGRRPPAQRRRG